MAENEQFEQQDQSMQLKIKRIEKILEVMAFQNKEQRLKDQRHEESQPKKKEIFSYKTSDSENHNEPKTKVKSKKKIFGYIFSSYTFR